VTSAIAKTAEPPAVSVSAMFPPAKFRALTPVPEATKRLADNVLPFRFKLPAVNT